MKTKIVFFGNERIATAVNTSTPTLKTLVESGYDVCAVVVNNEKSMSRKQRELEIETYANRQNIPILSPNKPSAIIEQLQDYKADIGILVAYGKIIPQSIIDIFPHGIINIHPSLLPLHRGSTPIESVILNGAKTTGVSVMSLQKEMDAGPVYNQIKIEISGSETKQELADKLLAVGAEQLSELLPIITTGKISPVEQNHDAATYDEQINKSDGTIDWNFTAIDLERQLRAYAGWPQSRTKLGNLDVIITSAHTVPSNFGNIGDINIKAEENNLLVQTADGCLSIDKIKPAGKTEMDIQSFLAGYKSRIG